MNSEAIKMAQACTEGSEAGSMKFPEVLAQLASVGIERYHADLLCGRKTYYTNAGAWCDVACRAYGGATPAALSAADVERAIRSSQRGLITYQTFCEQITKAGCVGYFVTIVGRRAVYYGISGDTFVEPFPD